MVVQPPAMESPEDLNDTDVSVLNLLLEGRETRGSLAAQVDKHENYIGERLKWLRFAGLVQYHHQETALYEITETGRQWLKQAPHET